MKQIDKVTYKIGEESINTSTTKKTQIVVGLSLRKEDYHIKRLKRKDYGKSKKWNTFTISRSGKIYQHYDPKYVSEYIGKKPVDKRIISIVLENMGSLIVNEDGNFVNWLNEGCSSDVVIEKKWMSQKYWEKFPQKQITSLISLCKYLCDGFDIPKNIIEFHHYHSDIIKYNGIALKSNYFEDSSSINPFLDLDEINTLLNK